MNNRKSNSKRFIFLIIVAFASLILFTSVSLGAVGLGPWELRNPLPAANFDFASIVHNNTLYIVGQMDDAPQPTKKVYFAGINPGPSIGAWNIASEMNSARQGLSVSVIKNYLYAFGGFNGSAINSVERSLINNDGSLAQWQTVNPMNSGRFRFGIVNTGKYFYALGGADINLGPVNTAERAMINDDGSLGTWTEVGQLPDEFGLETSVVNNNDYVYLIGGAVTDGVQFFSTNKVAFAPILNDGSIGNWNYTSDLPKGEHSASAQILDGFVYLFGGNSTEEQNPYLDKVIRAPILSDGTLGQWVELSPMTTIRSLFETVRIGNYVYALGGTNLNSGDLSSIERAEILPVDTIAPTANSLLINAGALATTSQNVILTSDVNDPTDAIDTLLMKFSNDGTSWSAYRPYSKSITWTLTDGNGLKTVYVRFMDPSGNESNILTTSIYFDNTVPEAYGVSINNGNLFTNNVNVELSIGAEFGTSKMQVSNDGGFSGSIWEPFNSKKDWLITEYGNQAIPRIVYVKFLDKDGKITSTYQDDIVLDTSPPVGSVQISPAITETVEQANEVNEIHTLKPKNIETTMQIYLPITFFEDCGTKVQLLLSATDTISGVGYMLISNRDDFSGTAWRLYKQNIEWCMPANSTVYVKYEDLAGNISETYHDSLIR